MLPLVLLTALFTADGPSREILANWHQWRGPLATGVAPLADPPIHWDEKTNIKWKVAVPGRGSSTPIVWGNRIYVLTAVDTGKEASPDQLPKEKSPFEKKTTAPKTLHQFLVHCLDRNTGKTIWQKVATERAPHEGHHETHSYAASSPMTDGKHVYASFGSYGIYCYTMDGDLRWQRDLGLMHTRLGWGEGATPTLHGDALIVPRDQEVSSSLIVLDANTGETRWKVDRDEPTSWSTPLVADHAGRTQVIISATNRVRSYDLKNGQLIWQCGGQSVNAIPSPVLLGDTAICMSGYKTSMACAIPLDAQGDVTNTAKVLWKHERGTPYVPSPVLVGDRLYFTQSNNALLSCLNAKTGKVLLDRERLPGVNSFYASPVSAKGRLYFVGRNGTTLVLKHEDKLEVLATNPLDEEIDASPVLVGKQLLLRGKGTLYCVEEK